MTYRDFFRSITDFDPYPYQERVADKLQDGSSVVLRVPTGAGKTWAAVAPFLYSIGERRSIADRLLYALPLRSLAVSTHAAVQGGMKRVFHEVSSAAGGREYGNGQRYCSLQMGAQKDDPYFESDVICTTIDQLLSGYLFMPVSLSDRVGNINAGALIGSLVVFDEIHLLDADVALGTTIEMLDRIRGLCRFVLMTATMSDEAVAWLAHRLGAEAMRVEDDEIRALPSQRSKHRTWRWREEPITANGIKAAHDGGRTIVLINSVSRAQDIFLDLEKIYAEESAKPELMLLHARFYPDDRKRIEAQLPEYFGPRATKSNVILVTTQVIEAGIDISADQLHTELAPMNALVQRAGRAARYEERPIGVVTVYPAEGLGPYNDRKALVEATDAALRRALPAEGREVDFIEEREWVREIHGDLETRQLKEESTFARRAWVGQAMDQGERGLLKRLVRDIRSVAVTISSDPAPLFERRDWPQLLSLSPFSFRPLDPCFDNLSPGQWVARGATEEQSDERPGVLLKWTEASRSELWSQWLIAIHPDFASYCPKLGLRLGVGGPEQGPPRVRSAQARAYEYRFEPWTLHSERTIEQAQGMRPCYTCAAETLAQHYSVAPDLVESLVELTCALHDVGKLTVKWQQAAWRWQDEKDRRARAAGREVPQRVRVPLAHTWFEPDSDRNYRSKFPPHAAQGAYAIARALAEHVDQLGGLEWARTATRCALSAIARHHQPRTRECDVFQLSTLRAYVGGRYFPLEACPSPAASYGLVQQLLLFASASDIQLWPLFAFLVRRLRLADQRASSFRTNSTEV